MAQAAELGSDIGAYELGEAFFSAHRACRRTRPAGTGWKIADGECAHKHMSDSAKERAAGWLGRWTIRRALEE